MEPARPVSNFEFSDRSIKGETCLTLVADHLPRPQPFTLYERHDAVPSGSMDIPENKPFVSTKVATREHLLPEALGVVYDPFPTLRLRLNRNARTILGKNMEMPSYCI